MKNEDDAKTSKEFLTIFEYIEKETKINDNNNERRRFESIKTNMNETNVLFVGEHNSGKTSLVNAVLGRKGKCYSYSYIIR